MKGGNYKDPCQDSVQLPALLGVIGQQCCDRLHGAQFSQLSLSLSRRMVGEYNVISTNYKTSKFTAHPWCKNL